MPAYKILSTDLDGTLFTHNTQISEENERAIEAMTDMGVLFVPNSGRTLTEMPESLINHPRVRYIIYADGAAVLDKETGSRISLCMPQEVTREVMTILRPYQTSISLRRDGKCYTNAADHQGNTFSSLGVNEGWSAFFRRFSHPVENFLDFCNTADTVEMICAFFPDEDERQAAIAVLKAYGEVQIAHTAPNNIEIFSRHAGKGNALLALAAHCGIDPASTIAVGDSTNDSDMIKKAGLGLAMKNACPELKAIADAEICDNHSHAMAYILEHYIKI